MGFNNFLGYLLPSNVRITLDLRRRDDWPLIRVIDSISNPRELAVWIEPNCQHHETDGWEAVTTGLPDNVVSVKPVTECLARFNDLEWKGWLLEDKKFKKHFIDQPTYRNIIGNDNWNLKIGDKGYYKILPDKSMDLVEMQFKMKPYPYFEWHEEPVK